MFKGRYAVKQTNFTGSMCTNKSTMISYLGLAGVARNLPVHRSARAVCMATRSADGSCHQGALGVAGGPGPCPHGGGIHPCTTAADIHVVCSWAWRHYPCCSRISAVCYTEVLCFCKSCRFGLRSGLCGSFC